MTTDYRAPLDTSLFILQKVIGWERLFGLPEYKHVDADTARSVLAEGARFAEGVLAPLNRAGDEQGSHLTDAGVRTPRGFPEAFAAFAEGGWPGLDMPEQFGGQNLPLLLQVAFAEMVNGACVSFGMLPIMLRAGARLVLEYGSADLVQRVVPGLVRGEFGATICITEAQAGSDVGRIRTRAVPETEHRYRVSGGKIFISYGDHDLTEQIIHLVLARTPDAAPGTRGLSLFLVPKLNWETGAGNGVTVSRVEKKMGLKASPTCVLDLDNAAGWRIGPEGQGLRCMFTMVNLMRLEVSIQGVALAEAATAAALDYARERPQGGAPDSGPVPIIEHADVRRMLLIMRTRTDAMRALVFETAMNLDLARSAADSAERERAAQLAEFLLPVCKTCGSEAAFQVASMAVQVLGGHGYMCEAGVEQYLRDSRVMSIYEGTSGIQSLDLLLRKVLRDEGVRYRRFIERVETDLERLQSNARAARLAVALRHAVEMLNRCTRDLTGASRRDAEAAASDYMQLVGLTAGAWMWLRMAAAADDDANFSYAEFYMRWLLPQAALHASRIGEGADLIDTPFSTTGVAHT